MAVQRKKGISIYILPGLFCALLIVLAVLRGRTAEQPVKAVLQASEPLTLTEQAIENYLYSAGFILEGEIILDGSGQAAGTLAASVDGAGEIDALTLTFPLPTYYETEAGGEVLAGLKEKHDRAAQRGEDMFLALFDAIAATDARVAARRDSAEEKLRAAMDSGKAASQAANSWRFSFSLEPETVEGKVTVLLEKTK